MNKKSIMPLLIVMAFLWACTTQQKAETTSIDVARTFIRHSLDGNFEQAKKYLSNNPKNAEYFDAYKLYYEKLPAETQSGYKNASVDVMSINDANDSTSIITFSNSFKKEPMELKLVREDGHWAVDFEHSYKK